MYYKEKILSTNTLWYTIAVTLAVRSHLFSYRTQKLSSPAPTILDWRRSGKIGSCCIQKTSIHQKMGAFLFEMRQRIFPAILTDRVRERVAPALSLVLLNCFLNTFRKELFSTMRHFASQNRSCCIQKTNPTFVVGFFLLDSTTVSRPDNRADCVREEVESIIQGITNCSGTIFIFTKYPYSSLIDMIANAITW